MDNIEDLKKEIVSLKIKIRRLEEFVLAMPNGNDYIHEENSDDPAYEDAVKVIKNHDEVSASMLQRKLAIGYSRAARILDQLEEKGYLEPAEGSKPRKVIKK